jgi:DNA-binding CsgD family transcriptional regulator
VLALVADGLTSRAIGEQLFIAEGTANFHVRSILNKLGVSTRAQAVAEAARRGLL